MTPDVVVDFTSVTLSQDGPDRVKVTGAQGSAPTDSYKVSISLKGGWKAVGQLVVGGRDAVSKAQVAADMLWNRLAADGYPFEESQRLSEILGTGVVLPGLVGAAGGSEVVLRVAVRDNDRRKVDRFGKELASLLTAGPPGLTGFAAGRPKPSEVVSYWPSLIPKDRVPVTVSTREVG